MWNASLDESQAGIKTAGRNINNLRNADDTTLMAESEEELKSLLMKVKGVWKSQPKTKYWKQNNNNKKRTKIMASGPIAAASL